VVPAGQASRWPARRLFSLQVRREEDGSLLRPFSAADSIPTGSVGDPDRTVLMGANPRLCLSRIRIQP
jgi:hypothetical protein